MLLPSTPHINIQEITGQEVLMQQAFDIRYRVFVLGQGVTREEEYDEFEDISRHYLAYVEQEPCGTARWRHTPDGIKLERFAVLDSYRNKGVGQALVRAVMKDVQAELARMQRGPNNRPGKVELPKVYLNAQLPAMSLYKRFGFEKTGPRFTEAGLEHYKMVWDASGKGAASI